MIYYCNWFHCCCWSQKTIFKVWSRSGQWSLKYCCWSFAKLNSYVNFNWVEFNITLVLSDHLQPHLQLLTCSIASSVTSSSTPACLLILLLLRLLLIQEDLFETTSLIDDMLLMLLLLLLLLIPETSLVKIGSETSSKWDTYCWHWVCVMGGCYARVRCAESSSCKTQLLLSWVAVVTIFLFNSSYLYTYDKTAPL